MTRALVGDDVAVRAVGRTARADVDDRALRLDLDAEALREVQVVLDQRVLGVVAAPEHARAAATRPSARG